MIPFTHQESYYFVCLVEKWQNLIFESHCKGNTAFYRGVTQSEKVPHFSCCFKNVSLRLMSYCQLCFPPGSKAMFPQRLKIWPCWPGCGPLTSRASGALLPNLPQAQWSTSDSVTCVGLLSSAFPRPLISLCHTNLPLWHHRICDLPRYKTHTHYILKLHNQLLWFWLIKPLDSNWIKHNITVCMATAQILIASSQCKCANKMLCICLCFSEFLCSSQPLPL